MLTAEGRPNWRQLAGELQFTYDEICNLAVNKETAAEKMLWTWQTSNKATMDRLYEALYIIKRKDIASFVKEYALEGVVPVWKSLSTLKFFCRSRKKGQEWVKLLNIAIIPFDSSNAQR